MQVTWPQLNPAALGGATRINRPVTVASQPPDTVSFSGRMGDRLRLRRALAGLQRKNPTIFEKSAMPIDQWLEQFDTTAEKLLVIRLLENFRYYDVDDVRQMARRLHRRLMDDVGGGFDPDKTKFTHFAVGKSGGLVQYFYRQANRLSNQSGMVFERAANPPRIDPEKPVENLVIVEDFLGSGMEADYFFTRLMRALAESDQQYKNIYFLSLVGFQDGIDLVRDKFPQIKVICAEVHPRLLDDDHPVFSKSEQAAFETLLNKYGEKIYPTGRFGPVATPFGYRNGQALTAFFHNTPTNTLPIFWSGFDGWQPLFPRFDSFNREGGDWRFPTYGEKLPG